MLSFTTFGLLGPLGVKELVLILIIALVIFGPKKLPEIGKSVGQMLSSFREGSKESADKESETKEAKTDNGDNKPGQG